MLEKDIQEVLFSEEQLSSRVNEIARQITQDYHGKEIVLISVLRGSFVFMADLCRRIDLPCTVDFMAVSSYGSGTSSTGQVQITKDLSSDIAGKHIIVVEDILDSGNTLSYLLKLLAQRQARLHPAVHPAGQAGAPHQAGGGPLLRLYHPGRVRGGLWPGLCRALPQSALHRDPEA